MDVQLQDADSRVIRLLTDFYAILDAQDMDGLAEDEPVDAVQILVRAFQPIAFRQTVQSQLKKSIHKKLENSVPAVVDWLTEKLDHFLVFEAHIPEAREKSAVSGRKLFKRSVKPPSQWPNQATRNTSLEIGETTKRSVSNVAQKSIGYHNVLTLVKRK
uniref:Uncharacterized protein AlNc14C318G10563 n=1 Tax=Albugo laibachii Nc14 TaxID=890382 RepID=F0WWC8_9STRA|nr:conserved hypothetical protein [Albugo laibachii Nc14]|eukprot:CCA25748.1 conserved hypothetical protein [Albugo laibachii Nc14]